MSHGTKLTKQKNLSSFFSMMAKVCGVFVRFGFSLKNETAPFFSVSELAQVCLLLLDFASPRARSFIAAQTCPR